MRFGGSVTDTRPLRNPEFRNLWIASTLGAVGIQIATVAVLQQVWVMTSSPFWTGMIGISTALPILLLAFVGGALADRLDRRTLTFLTTAGQLVTALGLSAQAIWKTNSLTLVLLLISLQAACGALGAPAKRTMPVRLLPRNQVAAGLALQNIAFQASMLTGPALAGIILAQWGFGIAYGSQALMYAASLVALTRLPKLLPTNVTPSREPGRAWGGLRLIMTMPVLWGSFATDIAATVLAMPIALFPLINQEHFGGDPKILGLFLTSMAVGGIGAGLLLGQVTRLSHSGIVQLLAAGTWGVSLAALGLSDSIPLSFACLALAGAADTVSVVTRGAVVQLAVPDSHRGRISAFEHAVGVAGPELGNFRAGLFADITSASVALVIGGLAAAASIAVVAATNAPLRRYQIAMEPAE